MRSLRKLAPSLNLLPRLLRQVAWVARHEGACGVVTRVGDKLSRAAQPRSRSPVRTSDLLRTDLANPFSPRVLPIVEGEPVELNWVMTAPGPGSGGHSTIFRVLCYLEQHGYRSRVYFYDQRLTDIDHYREVVRNYYGFAGPVLRLESEMADAHGVIATSWSSAYATFNARCAGKRFYFVQDFEPDFYPVSAERVFAENTYRMGFHALTAGPWLARKLSTEYGMAADSFSFGCDTSRYRNLNQRRTAIACYAKPSAPRRGFEIASLALEIFAARRPDIDIYLFGERIGALPFRFDNLGAVSPERLNEIYNRCYAAVALSLTNVSLVPLEMLAAGCIPVVNDAPHNRMVLDSPHIRYVACTPQAIATALEEVVSDPQFAKISKTASSSQRDLHWDDAGAAVDQAIRRAINGAYVP